MGGILDPILLREHAGAQDACWGLSTPGGLLPRLHQVAEGRGHHPAGRHMAHEATRAGPAWRQRGSCEGSGRVWLRWDQARPVLTFSSGKNNCSHVIWPKSAHLYSTSHAGGPLHPESAQHVFKNSWEPTVPPDPPRARPEQKALRPQAPGS